MTIICTTRHTHMKFQSILIDIDACDTHRLIASRQTAAYKHDKSQLSTDTIMIDIDWKQKVVIGKLPKL